MLCHEPTLLDLTGEILNYCRNEDRAASPALLAAVELLTRSPGRFSAAQFNPLTEEGLPAGRAIALLTRSALDGWLERLKVALGKAE
ncbi:putative oxidoreductase [Enterobacter cloacae]|uniref:Putative oxidoreductase n=1 Tax=Enterobacter cloacae TaxID=550 RepID=A0A377LZR7_ENTCL|nr:putative oxidoreductase [Enterobacter cloacae]